MSMRASCSVESFTSAAPTSCSSCICRLRRVLLIKSSSSIAVIMPDHPDLPPCRSRATRWPMSPRRALDHASKRGASNAEVEVSAAVGQSITVRRGEVETVEYNRDKGLGITVYFGKRRGNASTSDLSPDAVERTVEAACAIARHTAEDEAAGLPDADRLYVGEAPDLDLFHPWGLTVEEAIEIARRTEAAALAVDKRITNSEGATVSAYDTDFILANTRGFLAGFPNSKASLGCSVVAEDARGMQRDYWYTTHRDPKRLEGAESVGRTAGERAVAPPGRAAARHDGSPGPLRLEHRLGAHRPLRLGGERHRACIGSRRSSWIASARRCSRPRSRSSRIRGFPESSPAATYDAEGVATERRTVVEAGVLKGWYLSSHSARKLGLATTGNAGGNHNLIAEAGRAGLRRASREDGARASRHRAHGAGRELGDGRLLARRRRASGSRAARSPSGRGSHHRGQPAGHVPRHRRRRADDVLVRGSKHCGSILVERMTIAGD